MIHTITKMLFVLLLVGGALGCEPYHRHHYRDYRGSYDPGYYDSYGYGRGGYGLYPAPSDGRYRRNWDERHHHHDDD
jgi:hypothetical protein